MLAERAERKTQLTTPSTCASAASAWGSQKVMSMERYSAIAVDSAVRPALADLS